MSYTPPSSRPIKSMKGQMRCFQCRQSFPSKDGKWLNWKSMQVFLCKPCDVATQERPERRDSN